MLDPVGVDLLDLVHVQVELGSLPKKQKTRIIFLQYSNFMGN